LDKSAPNVFSESLLGKALSYALNQWARAIRYPEYGLPLLCNDFLTKIKRRAYMRFLIEDAIF
jgi:hypothetical protein